MKLKSSFLSTYSNLFCILGSLFIAVSCNPDAGGYSCINGDCIPISDNAQFSNLEACLLYCDSVGYNCVNGNCITVPRDSAIYYRLIDCESSCP